MSIIQTLLSLNDEQGRSCKEVKTMAEDQLVVINAKIDNLERLRAALKSLSKSCDDGTSSCPMLDSLMSDAPTVPL